MKKIILAGAIASILAPIGASADTTVYGALRVAAVSGEKGDTDIGGVVNNASRIGVKGEYGEEGGTIGFFNIQEGVKTDSNDGASGFTNRFALAGIKGGFGTVMMGRLSSPYKMAGLKLDPFYDTTAGPANGGSNYGLSSLTNGWLNNVVAYVSPKLGGAVSINVVAVLDDDDNAPNIEEGDDFFNLGVTYSGNGLTAAVQHITELEATRYSLGYNMDAFSVGVSFEDLDEGEQTYLSGTYNINEKISISAAAGNVEGVDGSDSARDASGDGYSFGVNYKVASKTTISAILSEVDYDEERVADREIFSVGIIQKF